MVDDGEVDDSDEEVLVDDSDDSEVDDSVEEEQVVGGKI